MWAPVEAIAGIVKVAPVGITPAAVVMTDAGVVVRVVVSNFTVIADAAAKFEPVKVTVEPAVPEFELKVIAAVTPEPPPELLAPLPVAVMNVPSVVVTLMSSLSPLVYVKVMEL